MISYHIEKNHSLKCKFNDQLNPLKNIHDSIKVLGWLIQWFKLKLCITSASEKKKIKEDSSIKNPAAV